MHKLVRFSNKYSFNGRLLISALLLTALASSLIVSRATTQTSDNPWSDPVNLSHSGSTTDPRIVVDSDGGINVIWVDAYSGTLYTYNNGDQWSPPHPVNFPFGTERPHLFATPNGRIFAFWIDQQGMLYYSSVKAANFGDPTMWAEAHWMADSAVAVDLAFDTQGRLHLVYLRNADIAGNPAGVYYQRSSDGGYKWTTPDLLYQSPYFRGLTASQASLQITSAEGNEATRIFVAWDNRPRKQIMLARSNDYGRNWEAPIEIAKPEANSESTSPFQLRVGASGDKVLLIWQDGDPAVSCTQYYQVSLDGGNTWSERLQMLEDINGCAQDNRILSASDSLFILQTTVQERAYLLAMYGSQWSTPQPQDALDNFTDPDTYNTVSYRCRQLAVQPREGRLLVAGCDANASPTGAAGTPTVPGQAVTGAGDIWLMSRPLGTVSDWFPEPPTWSVPSVIASSQTGFSSPILVADAQEGVHAFWTQINSTSTTSGRASSAATTSVYYSRWDGERWTRPSAVLSSPVGDARQPAVTMDAMNHVLAVWSGGDGGIYFSAADVGQATSASDWSTAQVLPSPRLMGNSPDIIVDLSGTIYVAYAIPLNEERGIYLTISKDDGKSWSQPVQVFDGAAAGWEMVDRPQLALTGAGQVHLLWTRSTIPSGTGPQALYYSRSVDSGQTWSEAQQVVEKRVVWRELIGLDNGTLHRSWQEETTGRGVTWHQYSLDNGLTWSRATSISSFGTSLGPAVLSADRSGRLHMLQLNNSGEGLFSLQHWVWQGERWSGNEGLELGKNTIQKANALAVAISPAGKMSILYDASMTDQQAGELRQALYFTLRTLDIPAAFVSPPAVTAIPTETSLPTEAPTAIPTTLPTPLPTADLSGTGGSGSRIDGITLPGSWGGMALGAGLAVVIVGVAFGVVVFRLKTRKQ